MIDSRLQSYLRYHDVSIRDGDVDPHYAMLRYVCDRFELNVEQRYWIAWLYAMCYSGANTFYWYNEFPDFENCDVGRMTRWWFGGGRERSLCQTDRRWVRSSSMFIPAFESYRAWLGGKTQAEHFSQYAEYSTPETRYEALYADARSLYSFGQFALFIYLEALHVVTPLNLCPTDLDLDKAWSCRHGLLYAFGLDHLINERESRTQAEAVVPVADSWAQLRAVMAERSPQSTVWNVETTLCAYRKWMDGKRYLNAYVDRQGVELAKLEDRIPDGVCWDLLWQFRLETYQTEQLAECHEGVTARGLTRQWKDYVLERTSWLMNNPEAP